MADMIPYIPIVTTVFAALFTAVLYRHWQRTGTQYLLWWMIGVAMYGVGTFAESLHTVFGWHVVIFKSWYIAGALLGGWPLAQGTAYLLFKKRTADVLTWLFGAYIAVAAVAVVLSPIDQSLVTERLSGEVFVWEWVRLFSPLVNGYAAIVLIGGAILSAVRYWRRSDRPYARVWGNASIALGALLPGIGGSFARAGFVEVLYVTELVGLAFIWTGYRVIAKDTSGSIHANQREVEQASAD